MQLYHYTSSAHLRGIHNFGLTVGDVVTDFEKFEGRIAVWLTSSLSPEGHGLSGSAVDKTEFRLTVDVPEDERLVQWIDWARKNVSVATQQQLVSASGPRADTWYVFFGWLPPSRIIEVVATRSGRRIGNWGEYLPVERSLRGVSFEGRHAWHYRMLRDVRRAAASRAGLLA